MTNVQAQIFEASQPFHSIPINAEWGVGPLFSPSEVHHQHLGLADISLDAALLTPQCQVLQILYVSCLIIV